MNATNYREKYANDVSDLDLLKLGQDDIEQQVSELIEMSYPRPEDDALAVTQILWDGALQGLAEQVYRKAYPAVDDKEHLASVVPDIEEWLKNGEPLDEDDTLESIVEEWIDYIEGGKMSEAERRADATEWD